MTPAVARSHAALCAALALLPVVWALDLPQMAGMLLYPEQVAGVLFGLGAAGVFLKGLGERTGAARALDALLLLASVWVAAHIYLRFPVLSEGAFFHPEESLALGIGVAVVGIEALRRVAGWSLIAILALLVLYALFSDMAPGRLEGRPIPPADILRFIGTDSNSTLGAPLQVAAFIVVLFILFGRLLVVTGGAEVLTDAARRLAGERRGATAKMAVIASGFMGSISGSAVSNVMSTGVITIPAMRRAGFPPQKAGAIEAVASTGGQIMPPVMGAAAFLMAEFLRLPYQAIILAALIPAALYFYSVYLQISLVAERDALGTGDESAAKLWGEILPHTVIVLAPMAMLLVGLFAFNMPAGKAVVWASGVLIVVGLLDLGRRGRIGFGDIARAVVETGAASTQILLICAVAGMIIGLLSSSGLSFGLTFVLLELGKGSLLLLLLLTAGVSIILGMGLPTTGVYLLLATLAAPPLVQLGIGGIEAHFFVLYFGLLSMISPPVALASFAAASVAGGPAMRTAVESVRFGWIAFILPFVFVYQPGLLMQGTWAEILVITASTLVAIPLVTAALAGYGRRRLAPVERGIAGALGVLAILPHTTTVLTVATAAASLAGAALIAAHVMAHRGTASAAAE
ncbi:TRAP transporter permease [Rhodosalinus halophilus]|uniref:TRAP transporter permease n=1 Tax=Rhodosalinus halophilus TaxID=2259333 RepID=UPI0013145094|nr:TRAP transporter fused permease subunit [Rhodosalinus halophilus]